MHLTLNSVESGWPKALSRRTPLKLEQRTKKPQQKNEKRPATAFKRNARGRNRMQEARQQKLQNPEPQQRQQTSLGATFERFKFLGRQKDFTI